jgi:uncharacterized membrane protein
MAILAHVLQLVGTFIAPLVILLVKRESRFVSFHALQALLLQGLYVILIGVMMVSLFMSMFVGMATHQPASQDHHAGPPPLFFFFLFPLIWLGMMGFGVMMMVAAIVYGIKAGRGEWAEYPLLGRLARRILKLGPGGTALSDAA